MSACRPSSKGRGKSAGRARVRADLPFPVVLPPYGTKRAAGPPEPHWGSCLLYLESLSVFVFDATRQKSPLGVGARLGSEPEQRNRFGFGAHSVDCSELEEERKAGRSVQFE